MSEENIIKHDFGGSPVPERPVSEVEGGQEEGSSIVEHDFRSTRQNSDVETDSGEDIFGSMIDAQEDHYESLGRGTSLFSVMAKIDRLNPSRSSVSQGETLVKDYTIDEIKVWLERATDNDIARKPGFYTALANKYKMIRRMR